MGLMDFFTPEAGRQRRRWLDAQLGGMWEFVPPEMRPFVALGNEMNPVTSIERAGQDARRVVAPNVSGWDRMAAAGDMASNMAGVVAPMVAASKGAVPAVQAAEDALMGWSASSPAAFAARDFMADEFGGVGFRAYHGSPHDFDRFDLSKIGTGEGAQAYGHGLYFADNEAVARNYRDNLSGNAFGVPFVSQDVRGWLDEAGGDYEKAAKEARAFLREYGDQMGANEIASLREAIKLMDAKRQSWGRMYEVQINADPNDFLDWDKPFSSADDVERFAARFDAVDPALRKRIEDFGYVRQQMGQPMPDGNDIIREVMGGIGSKDAARASEAMREAGIPGIRYLDAGSRGAGDGSRNYVVFDDKLIEILRKYGLVPGMIGAGAYGMQPTEAQAGQ